MLLRFARPHSFGKPAGNHPCTNLLPLGNSLRLKTTPSNKRTEQYCHDGLARGPEILKKNSQSL
jgi:hypothetical protein